MRSLSLAIPFVAAAVSVGAAADLSIEHSPVGCVVAEKFPQIEARVGPTADVARVRLHFRAAGGPHWYFVEMTQASGVFRAVLPKPKKETRKFEYYVEAIDRTSAASRTAEYAPEVAAAGACPMDVRVATSVATATVAVSAPAGVPPFPPGFSASGIAPATAAGVAAGAGTAGAAGVAGAGTVAAAGAAAATGGISTTAVVIGVVAVGAATATVVTTTGGGDATSGPTAISFMVCVDERTSMTFTFLGQTKSVAAQPTAGGCPGFTFQNVPSGVLEVSGQFTGDQFHIFVGRVVDSHGGAVPGSLQSLDGPVIETINSGPCFVRYGDATGPVGGGGQPPSTPRSFRFQFRVDPNIPLNSAC